MQDRLLVQLRAARQGSVLVVVLWTLAATAVALFALQAQSLDGLAGAHEAYERECARWAARGGLHYAIGDMEARHPGKPDAILDEKQPPRYYREHRDEATGWFIAEFPHPSREVHYGIKSEQARMPLSNLTTGALNALFQESAVRTRVRARIATGRSIAPAMSGTPPAAPTIRHPFELLCVEGLTLDQLLGQDWNDNGILDPHEQESRRQSGCSAPLLAAMGLAVDRGLADVVTASTDGRFDPVSAPKAVREAFLADWGSMIPLVEQARRGESLDRLERAPAGWAAFAKRSLTTTPVFFRVPVIGTARGRPVTRLRAVVEYQAGDAGGAGCFRVAGWREEA